MIRSCFCFSGMLTVRSKSCRRCALAGQVCSGYKDESELVFRNYCAPNPVSSVPEADLETSLSTIPPRNALLTDFIKDFVVEPTNRDISRGFLDGLPSLLTTASSSSVLSRAAALVELTVLRNRQLLTISDDYTVKEYCDLLQCFQGSLSTKGDRPTVQVLATAVLLGLYEVSRFASDSSACF